VSTEPFAENAIRDLRRVLGDEGDGLVMAWAEGRRGGSLREVLDKQKTLKRELDRLLQGGLAEREPRRVPSLAKVADHHGLDARPSCVRCGYEPPVDSWREASGWLQRAHVIDRFAGGLDNAANLRPLCRMCHRMQPIFVPGDEDVALEWFSGEHYWRDLARLLNESDAPKGVAVVNTLDPTKDEVSGAERS
jgi:hypothetical protein